MEWNEPWVLRLHKPAGESSFDMVRKLKRILPKAVKKIGYFGTLDPFAEGLLLIALNQANRLTQYVHNDLTKSYEAVGVLGVETATQDLTVAPTQNDITSYFSDVISKFDLPFYQQQMKTFLGKYLQAPPAYSAAKFQGKKLCEWMREDGIEIKKEQVQREIYKLEILDITFPELKFDVECSSGTYIRTLFVDMANKIGTIGSLKTLIRKKIGKIETNDECSLENLLDKIELFKVDLTDLLPYPVIQLNPEQLADFIHGRIWSVIDEKITEDVTYWVQNQDKKIIGLAKQSNQKSKVLVGLH